MRDTRKTRRMLAVAFTAGIAAVIADIYLKPTFTRQLGVR